MPQRLNSLVISANLDVQHVLEDIMRGRVDAYNLRFTTCTLSDFDAVEREPDILFIESLDALADAEIDRLIQRFPRKTYIALAKATETERSAYLSRGIDEVISLEDLGSRVGRHLFEKMLALKRLAVAEMRAEQSEERFRGIIENSHDIIMLLDADGTIIYTSPAFGRQIGYESWEVLGQPLWNLLHEEDRAGIEQRLKGLMSAWASDGTALEYRFLRKDGAWRHFETIATNLLRTEPVRAVVLNSRDLTEQKAVEIELENYRRHLEELVVSRTREAEEANRKADRVVAASPDALIALDDAGKITFISHHYQDIYPDSAQHMKPGIPIGEAYDMAMDETGVPRNDPEYQAMRQWLLNPQGAKEYRRHNATWVRLHAKKIPGESGVVIATTDISDYKRQQAMLAAQSAELEDALEKERAAAEQQRTFISMVSHEFRTPLTIIDGNAQIIARRGETLDQDTLRKRAEAIRAAVDRLVRLIETILSAHVMETGKLGLLLAECDLERIIRDVCADQQGISPRHHIRMDIQDLPATMTLDKKLIRQIMSNLVSNAVKYSPEQPDVAVSAKTAGQEVVIRVQDRGIGIPEPEIPRMFQKYYRASTSGGIPGSGLGLNLVKQFVEMHGGAVFLDSKVGEGTTITVKLPIMAESIAR